MIKRTPQGIYHAPGRTVYHMVAIGEQTFSPQIQIPRKTSCAYLVPLSLSLSLLTWPPLPPSIPNIRWWFSLPGALSKATLGAVPISLYATLGHYVFHPITLSPPSQPVQPYSTLSPSPHRLRRSHPPPLKSYPPAPNNPLFIIIHGPSPIFLARAFLLITPAKF